MQPTNEPPQYPAYAAPAQQPYVPPVEHAAGWPPPGTGSWSTSGDGRSRSAATVRAARSWRVASAAFLTLLALIAAFGNQSVTNAIDRHAVDSQKFTDNLARSVTTYAWRFQPLGNHDFARGWSSSLAFLATALILTLLLVAVVARGTGGFWQAFIGTWLAVVVATMLATYVHALVLDTSALGPQRGGKANAVFYSIFSAGTYTLAAALGFGVIVALVAGLTAVLSRRTDVIGAAPPSGYAPSGYTPSGYPPPADTTDPEQGPREPWAASSAPAPMAGAPRPAASDEPPRPADQPPTAWIEPRPDEWPPSDGGPHTARLPSVDGPPPADPDDETAQWPRRDHRGEDSGGARGGDVG